MALWDVLGRSEALEFSGALARSLVFWCVLGRSEVFCWGALGRSGALCGFPCNHCDTGTTRIVVREADAEAEADVEAQFVL